MLSAHRDAIVDAWFAATANTYPAAVARSLASGRDRFGNPAGHLLRENLAALFDATFLEEDDARAEVALAAVVELRAVQQFDAAAAVGFIEPLKEIVRATAGMEPLADVDPRIERLAHRASHLYARCRARLAVISAREGTRRNFVANRLRGRV